MHQTYLHIITDAVEMQNHAERLRARGRTIGFVPTMGFLHDGHISLMRAARAASDVVVASIFVNPTQFGPREDLARYPRDREGDQRKCEAAGVDVLFMPEATSMYPDGPSVVVDVEGISSILEGAIRPGHFRGVATVVAKLFNIVRPHAAFFGQKDLQQCAIIKQMAAGLNCAVDIIVMPTVREPDGLAMSSRNSYLSAEERRAAPALYRALLEGEEMIRCGALETGDVQHRMRDILRSEVGLVVDYIAVVDPDTFAPLQRVAKQSALLIAARLGTTRLLDNIVVRM